MNAVITVLGKDNVGILAKVSNECAAVGVNIIEVTQSVFVDSLTEKGESMGVKIHVMHEDIFNAMHKI